MTPPNSTEPGGPDAAIAALAREMEILTRGLEALADLPDQVADLAATVARMAEQVRPAHRAAGGGAASWLDLPAEAGDAALVLAELMHWLGEVYLRYPDAVAGLPECWLWHPDVVEELLWIMQAWAQAYRSETGTIAAAGDWHDRARPGVVRRIRAAAGTCSLEAHQPRGERCRGADPVPLADALELIADWWDTHRTDTAPIPDDGHLAAATALRTWRGRR